MKCYLDTTWKANINSVNIYGGAVRDESVESCLLDTCKQVRGKMYTFIHGNENYEKNNDMNEVPVRCQAFPFINCLSHHCRLVKIYILPLFLPNDKN